MQGCGVMVESPSMNVLVVGGTTYDRVRIHSKLEVLDDQKYVADHAYDAPGGGGANVALTLKQMGEATGVPINVTLLTLIGRDSPGYHVRREVMEGLNGIDVRDMVANSDFRVPDNHILSFKKGRVVSKDPTVAGIFNECSTALDPGAAEQVRHAVRKADMIILQSNNPVLAELAALEAERIYTEQGRIIPVILDYSVSSPERANLLEKTIMASDYILAPAEAKLPGMDHSDGKNGSSLFDGLARNYKASFVAVSDGAHPILCFDGKNTHAIEVTKVANNVDQLGTGDVRDAAFAYFLLQQDDPFLALRKASEIASFSIQYPGRNWIKDVKEYIANTPVFSEKPLDRQPDMFGYDHP